MHKSKAWKEAHRSEQKRRAQKKEERHNREKASLKQICSQSIAERMMHASWISAFILGFLVWTERLSYPLGGTVHLLLLASNILPILLAYRLPNQLRTEALWSSEFLLVWETLALTFLRQPWRYICMEPHLPFPAILLFLAFTAVLAPLIRRLRSKIRLLPHILALTVLLYTFSFLWTEAINVSLDFHPAQEVAADRIDRRTGISGRGAAYYQVKLAFPQSDGSRTTRWFDVTHPQYFEDSFALLRRPGALGIIWYEPFFPY